MNCGRCWTGVACGSYTGVACWLRRTPFARPSIGRTSSSLGVAPLEVALQRRSAGDPQGSPRADPGDEPGQLVVGCAANPWRAAETRHRDRPIDRRQVYDQAPRTTRSELGHLLAQPCARDSRRGPVHRAHEGPLPRRSDVRSSPQEESNERSESSSVRLPFSPSTTSRFIIKTPSSPRSW
jgi:hypothetical protein